MFIINNVVLAAKLSKIHQKGCHTGYNFVITCYNFVVICYNL